MNKELQNRGWQAMKTTLDREMPRRRRYPLWVWPGSAALILLLGAASLYGYLSLAPQAQPIPGSPAEIAGPAPALTSDLQENRVTSTVAVQEVSSMSGSDMVTANTDVPPTAAVARTITRTDRHPATSSQARGPRSNRDRANTSVDATIHPVAGTEQPTANTSSSAIVSADHRLQDQSAPARHLAGTETTTQDESYVKTKQTSEPAQTDVISSGTVDVAAENIAAPEKTPVVPAIPVAAPVAGISWFVQVGTGMLVSPAARFTTNASAGIQYSFGPSWSIDGSLGYSYTDVSQEFLTYLGGRNALKDDMNNNAGSGGGRPIQSNEYLARLHLGNAQTAFARTTAVYSRKQWYVQFGLEFHRRINDPVKRAYQVPGLEASNPGSGPLLSAEEITQDYVLFNSWDLRLHTGIGYRLGSHLSLSLDYRHGLIGMVKYPVAYRDKFLHRGLDLGVRLSF